jgi:RNA polymerase sigma factor (sigma-70 family)
MKGVLLFAPSDATRKFRTPPFPIWRPMVSPMSVSSADPAGKAGWVQTPESFSGFLAWLDDGTETDGESYLRMRGRLVAYFDRRNCTNPDELADETLNRAARRLAEEGRIETESPAKYCYTLARFVFLEQLRSPRTSELSLDALPPELGAHSATANDDEIESREAIFACLENCTAKLEAGEREIIFSYYQGEQGVKIENRRRMAESLGISPNALSIRAYRIREKLEACVKKCADGSK